LAGAWLQRPERPRKKFNKICFLGLHGEIWDHNIGNFTNLVDSKNIQIWNYQIKIYIICGGAKTFGGGAKCFWGGANIFCGMCTPSHPQKIHACVRH
jgi:hypothetical protein